MSWMGQSAATQIAATPSPKHTAWRRVTAARPGSAYRGPTRTTTRPYAAAIAATSTHVSTCGCQAGGATARLMPGSTAEDVQGRQHDQVQGDRGDDPDYKEAAEDRLVGPQMHVPRRDQRELDHREHQQQDDDQPVGNLALEVVQPDLGRGGDHEDRRDRHVAVRAGVGTPLPRQHGDLRCGRSRRPRLGPFELGAGQLLFGSGAGALLRLGLRGGADGCGFVCNVDRYSSYFGMR